MPKHSRSYVKDDYELTRKKSPSINSLSHDSFFNNRKKSLFEAQLAKLVLAHNALFVPIINKVSKLILADFRQVLATRHRSGTDSLENKFYTELKKNSDLNSLYRTEVNNDEQFSQALLNDLEKSSADTFYKQLAMQRVYLNYFIAAGINPTNEFYQAVQTKWPVDVNLNQLLLDTQLLRRDLFNGYFRLKRPIFSQEPTSYHLGFLPPEDYHKLSPEEQGYLIDQMAEHVKGGFLYQITTKGLFTHQGMHHYDMPQLCGPSGMMGLRLALAKQAMLSAQEFQLYDLIIAMYHIGIGAHTLDESFSIGSGQTNQYQRGNYETIIPECIKTTAAFEHLWSQLQLLFFEYNNPMHNSLATRSMPVV